MVPEKSTKKHRCNRRNNLDLNTLVSHVSNLTTNELHSDTDKPSPDAVTIPEKLVYEKQLSELKKDRDCVETQLKFQVQVNTELKNLLVAAVGWFFIAYSYRIMIQ